MADCSTAEEMRAAAEAGADIVATTLCGYTEATRGRELPAFDVVQACAALRTFTILEGGVADPLHAQAGLAAGADAVVVGTAISNLDALVRRFATEVRARNRTPA
jgi:N-acylglucosamine-6-phosphate 2-epimerase